VVDPAAYTPPYDDALCRALGRAGAEVTLVTSRFAYGEVPVPEGYDRREFFYQAASWSPSGSKLGRGVRTAARLAEHVPDMLRYRRFAQAAEVVHFQWLPVQQLDGHLLPRRRRPAGGSGAARAPGRARQPALVLTAHDILPREPKPGQLSAQRRLYGRFDAIVVHSEHGRSRLTNELGVDPARVYVIKHGTFTMKVPDGEVSTTGAPDGDARPIEILDGVVRARAEAPFQTDRTVVLFFGLLRPYKGLDDLLEAWRGIEDAELWVVGMPRFDVSALRRSAPSNVRFLERFVSDGEMTACFERADLVVLPYREADQSGVAFTALGAGVPMLLSDVGGFPELAATGAAQTFPAGDVPALHAALRELLDDPDARAQMAERAEAAAEGRYSWDAIARTTLELYRSLTA
jgi:glycosyltransferase involved in cell wall biosynthesis